ncbi:MAG: hypothetical protein JOY91_03530 [Sinobacteraceae bacterium]|nr:hypothetical protein [Nevskiaceae bacterium]
MASRAELQQAVRKVAQRFGTPLPGDAAAATRTDVLVPRPAHWGGFQLWAQAVEL